MLRTLCVRYQSNKVLISACLLGKNVRYDGGNCLSQHPILVDWKQSNRLIPICPEVAGGLPVPRPPAEITNSYDGADVVDEDTRIREDVRVMSIEGVDVTAEYLNGAEAALALTKKHNIKVAVLKADSPSCSNLNIYDGTFSDSIVPGVGVATALLQSAGVQVFNEEQLEDAQSALNEL